MGRTVFEFKKNVNGLALAEHRKHGHESSLPNWINCYYLLMKNTEIHFRAFTCRGLEPVRTIHRFQQIGSV